MVRITGGEYRGRLLKVPGGGGVRPTQDRVRQALFSSLGPLVAGAHVLDLFAGTGALGLEALSRGAASATWVEQHPAVYSVLRENVQALCGAEVARVGCMRGDVDRYLARGGPGAPVDLVLADPPYLRGEPKRWCSILMDRLDATDLLAAGGVFVMEEGSDQPLIDRAGWSLLKDGKYGDTRLVIYRREERRNHKEHA